MPTIKQLPTATTVSGNDLLPISQGTTTRSVTVGTLLSSTQSAITLSSGQLVGRASAGSGGTELISLGPGVAIEAASLVATGEDHTSFPVSAGLLPGDEVVINSGLAPKRLSATLLRSLFSAGTGVQIDQSGTISATAGTGVVGPAGPQGPAGVGIAGGTVNGAGHLILTKTDTSTVDAGSVVGPQGPAGVALPGGASGQIQFNNAGQLAGLTVSGDGTLSNSGVLMVTKINGQSLSPAAFLPVGTAANTLAAGNDSRILGALQASAIPAASGSLLGGSGMAGIAATVTVGSGLSLSSGTLSATASAYTLPVATVTALGGVKQGTGVAIAGDGTISATGTAGVASFNTRSGAVTLTLTDVTGVLGMSGTARSNLGFAAVAASGSYSDLTNLPAIPGLASTGLPAADGVAALGTAPTAAHSDHVHPTDISRAPLVNPAFTGSITLPTWTTTTRPPSPVAGMEGYATDTSRLETYNGTSWVQYLRTSDIPSASGQLLGGTGIAGTAGSVTIGAGLSLSGGTLSATASSYTLPVATATALGGVKQGSGISIAVDGTITATGSAGVASFNTRSGAVALALADVTAVLGTGSTARLNLGLAAVAASGSYSDLSNQPTIPALAASGLPTANGTAALGAATTAAHSDHVHPTDATRAPLASPVFIGSITLPTWTTATRPSSPAAGMEGFATDTSRRETYTGTNWVQYVRTADIPAASGQLLGGTGTAGSAAAITLGSGLSLNGGTLTATSTAGVSTFNTRSGAVTLSLADVTAVLGTGSTAQSSLGLGGAALLNVGTASGTVAAGNDSRITGALQAGAIPAASGSLLGGSGSAGSASAVTIGAGLSLTSGTLTATGGNPTPRIITSSAATTLLPTDGLVVFNRASNPATTTVTLEANPVPGVVHRIKDMAGNAATYPITVQPSGGTIDGTANFVISQNRGSLTIEYNGSEWSVT